VNLSCSAQLDLVVHAARMLPCDVVLLLRVLFRSMLQLMLR
jgi:hypothetical protein